MSEAVEEVDFTFVFFDLVPGFSDGLFSFIEEFFDLLPGVLFFEGDFLA